MIPRHIVLTAGAILASAHLSAVATTVTEVESNDTLATAQYISSNGSSFGVNGSRTFADPSDDFYAFDVFGSGLLSIVSSSLNTSADSIMGLFGPTGMLLASNDDGPGGSAMSALQFTVAPGMTGRYTIGFSGFNAEALACSGTVTQCYDTTGDFVFDTFVAGAGSGGSTGFDYAIDIGGVALVPEPQAWLMLALGLPLLASLKRRRQGRRD